MADKGQAKLEAKARVGEVACLKIVSVGDAGAFLDWGLPKDLLLPWAEVRRDQKHRVVPGRKVLVAVFEAVDGRVAASMRLDAFLQDEAEGLREGDKVTLVVAEPTDLGLRVVVNHRYWGLVHANECFKIPPRGHVQDGYVKALRPDGKLNIALAAPGYAKVEAATETVLRVLRRHGGSLPVTDRTPPQEIYELFGMSKKAFKLALGALYRERRIVLEEARIRLAAP
ncbi:MAG TPA: hypothetical protein VK188_04750 [Holophaga sp.]|nr:hypothetical protein [Holophaga sp.]